MAVKKGGVGVTRPKLQRKRVSKAIKKTWAQKNQKQSLRKKK